MQEILVGHVDEFNEADRKLVVREDGVKVGVFKVHDTYYAYDNRCTHQGGPVCEGKIVGKVEAVIEEDRNVLRERLSDTDKHLVCPWHGYEYDLTTGEAAGDRRLKLRSYEVVEREGMVYIRD